MQIKAKKGFSLIELLIAIAILAVAVAVAAPSFIKYQQNTNLKEAARDLAADIQLYKARAVSEGIHYRISFDSGANNYTVLRGTQAGAPYVALNPDVTKKLAAFGSGVRISGTPSFSFGESFVTFEPRGTTGAGSAVLTNNKLSTATIITNTMGKVNVTFNML